MCRIQLVAALLLLACHQVFSRLQVLRMNAVHPESSSNNSIDTIRNATNALQEDATS